MKFIAYILTVYIFGLMLLPCHDDAPITTHQHDKTTIVAVSPIHHDHSSDIDLCSPFCECHCCSTTVNIQKLRPSNSANTKNLFVEKHTLGKERTFNSATDRPPQQFV